MKKAGFIDMFGGYERIVFLDSEMSGIDAQQDMLIRFKYVLWETGGLYEPNGFLIKLPEGYIFDNNISELVQISSVQLNENGKERDEAEDYIVDFLFRPNTLVCAHHIEFDLKFIFEILYKRNQTELFCLCDYLDSLTIMRDKIGKQLKQSELMRKLKIKRDKEDSLNIYHLFERLAYKYSDLPNYVNLVGGCNGTKEIKDIIRA